jgi:hypothetical protein
MEGKDNLSTSSIKHCLYAWIMLAGLHIATLLLGLGLHR